MEDGKFKLPEGVNKDDYNWTEPILGMVLVKFRGAVIDSYGKQIDENVFYVVGKSKNGGQNIIMPTDKNQKDDFLNDQLKDSGRLN